MIKFKGQSITRQKGKGSQSELLPSRHAMTQLTQGDPMQRSLSNYAKLTPIGLDAMHQPTFGDDGDTKI